LRRSGFTLIELLVVIAIIAILAAILFPVLVGAKQRSLQQHCLGNLKQLTIGVRLYADDWAGRVVNMRAGSGPNFSGTESVGGRTVVQNGLIFRYVRSKGVYLCPMDKGHPAKNCKQLNYLEQKDYPLSYAMNQNFWYDLGGGRFTTLVMDQTARPKDCLLLIHETRYKINGGTETGINDGDFNWDPRRGGIDIPDDVHYDGTTASFVDGHVRWISYKEMMRARELRIWEPVPGK